MTNETREAIRSAMAQRIEDIILARNVRANEIAASGKFQRYITHYSARDGKPEQWKDGPKFISSSTARQWIARGVTVREG